MSFQGGDGYQYFMNHNLAYASVARILEFCFHDKSLEKKTHSMILRTLELNL